MKILIVEDAVDVLDEITKAILPRFDPGEMVVARSRDSALALLEEEFFDLVVLDRKLPSTDGALDDHVSHGEAVYEHVRQFFPGTPIRFWTAYYEDEYIGEKIDTDVNREDIWGGGVYVTVGSIPKSRFDKITSLGLEIKGHLRALRTIEIRQRPGHEVEFTREEQLVLRIFARRQGGTSIEIQVLSGGLSGTKVVRASVLADARRLPGAVGKLGAIQQLEDEHRRQRYVVMLPAGALTHVVSVVRAGAGAIGGLFYRLADGYDRSLFDLLAAASPDAEIAVQTIRHYVEAWTQAARPERSSIGDHRRRFASDAVFRGVADQVPELSLADFENQEFSFQVCCCHGDLHGSNVLVDGANRVLLIDYGEVDEHAAALDPVSLELGALFHPNRPAPGGQWPSIEQAAEWCNLARYSAACPYGGFLRACREWAWEVGQGNKAMYVVAYCYLVKQFKYDDTNKELAKALIGAIVTEFSRI